MKCTKCEKCGYEIANKNFNRHINRCDGKIPRNRREKLPNKIKCEICNFEISKTQISNHKKKCNGEGPNKIKKIKLKGKGPGQNWIKGKKLKDVFGEKKFIEIQLKKAKSLKGKITGIAKDPLKEIERKRKISEKMKGNKNWENSIHVSGKGKKGKHKGHYFASSWELAFIVYCLDNKIKFERNWEKFEYVNLEGKKKFYIPDFKINDEYIEVKGYMNENVLLKQKHFPYKLQIYGIEKMKEILKYVTKKYGKNFVNVLKDN